MNERAIFTHKIGQFPVSRDLLGRFVACHVLVRVSWNVLTVEKVCKHPFGLSDSSTQCQILCILSCIHATFPKYRDDMDGRCELCSP